MSFLPLGKVSSHSTGKYRAEIDGLRAIAVGLVVLFHFHLTRFASGGFVGVDVFFVISGYLITKALQNDLQDGWSGIAEFYRRRILRIFPALFVVLGVCVAVELAIRFPGGIAPFRNAFLAAVLSASNFIFARSQGYFDFDSRDNGLLHTWSLSAEEQFYLLLPLILIAMRYVPRWAEHAIIWLIALASLIAAELVLRVDSSAAFYLVPFRMWEFLLGATLSLGMIPKVRHYLLAEGLSVIGLGLIAYAALTLGSGSPFPGANAIAPVLGTALVIHATESVPTLSARALSLWPVRLVGLVSYSFYLWHWPVFVYSKYFIASNAHSTQVLLILLSFVLALISWRFVEQPFRRSARNHRAGTVIMAGGGVMLAFLLVGVLITPVSRALWPERPGVAEALAVLRDPRQRDLRDHICFGSGADVLAHTDQCLGVSDSKPNVLLLGDSHAAQLWRGLSQVYPQVNVLQATAGSCTVTNDNGDPQCVRMMRYMQQEFLPAHRMALIILGGHWRPSDTADLRSVAQRLSAFADRVVVMGPFQDYSIPFSEAVARARHSGNPRTVERYRIRETIPLDRAMAVVDWGPRISYVSALQVLCQEYCAAEDAKGDLLMFDNDHLSVAGSVYFAERAVIPGLSPSPAVP
jgi:peptidoglycan/LPS O-acetylase OafA/YrhL